MDTNQTWWSPARAALLALACALLGISFLPFGDGFSTPFHRAAVLLPGLLAGVLLGCVLAGWGRRADLARQPSAAFLALGENAYDAITLVDARGTILYETPNASRIHGRKPGSSLGRPGLEDVHPEDRERTRAGLASLVTRTLPEPVVLEIRVHNEAGHWVWIQVSGRNLLDDPRVGAVVVHWQDITARKQVEAELRESRRFADQITATVPDIVYVYDLDRQATVYVNHAVHSILGYTEETIRELGRNLIPDLVHPDDLPALQEVSRRRQDGEAVDVEVLEFRMRHKAGGYRWLQSYGRGFSHEGRRVSQILGVARDVTAQKEAEQQLRESEMRYRLLADTTDDLIALVYVDGRPPYISPSVERVTGFSRDEILASDFRSRIHPDDLPLIESARAANLRGEATRVEYRSLCKDGTVLWLDLRATPLRGPDKQVDRILGWSRDVTARRRAEEDSKASEAQLRAITDAIPGFVYRFRVEPDGSNHFPFVSSGVTKVFGLTPEQACADPRALWEPVLPEDAEELRTLTRISTAELLPFVAEFRIRTPQGLRWVRADALPTRLADGATLWNGIITDITYLKETEERLRQTEAQSRLLALIASRTDNMVILTDALGRIEWVNPAFTSISGYELEEVRGRTPGSVLRGPDTDPEISAFMASRIRAGQSFKVEVLNYHRSGRPYWVAIEVQPLYEDGRLTHFMAIESDITERKKSEQALAERAAHAALAAEVGVSLTRNQTLPGLLRECTEALLRHLGAAVARVWTLDEDTEELVLQASAGLPDLVTGDPVRLPLAGPRRLCQLARDCQPWLTNALADDPWLNDLPWAAGLDLKAFAGHPLVVDGRCVGVLALFNRSPLSPTTLGVLATVADEIAVGIERLRTEAAMREAREAAEAGSRAKSAFLANMSHEIRTPLAGILGMTDLVLDSELLPQQREYLNLARSSAESLLGLLADILDFSKVEAGKLDLDPAPFDLRACLSEALELLGVRARAQGLHLSCTVDPQVPPILVGDAGRLRQCLLNLVGNSIKFTPSGAIDVSVRPAPEDPGAVTPADQVVVEFAVRDTGIGISPDKHQAIFAPFEQADKTTTRRYGGTGLGLAIVSSLVDLMGGRIAVESQPGQGSRFTFTARFGLLAPEALPAAPEAPEAPRWTRPLRILLAEDNEVNQVVAAENLHRAGHQVTVVDNGRLALEALAAAPFDLVLLDIQMPELDGFGTLAVIRAREAEGQPRVPVVALTANALQGDRERCLEAGFDGYVSKPIRVADLFATLERCTPEASTPAPRFTDALLQQFDGNRELLLDVTRLLLDHYPGWRDDLRNAVATGEPQGIRLAAHTLKGAVSSFTTGAPYEAAHELECLARAGNVAETPAALARLERAFETFLGELEVLLRP